MAKQVSKMIINGRYLIRRQTGQERFAKEIINELDKISYKNEFTLVCPIKAKEIPSFHNICVLKYGYCSKTLWEQLDLLHYSKIKKLNTLNLTSTCPIRAPDVTAVHDLLQEIHPEWFKGFYNLLSKTWHKTIMNNVVKKGKALITVSEFSKKEILSIRNFSKPILVLGNGWEHMNRIKPDFTILEKAKLSNKKFFFSLGSTTPQKNFKWILEEAKRNPDLLFVIAGDAIRLSKSDGLLNSKSRNLIFLGRITDEEMKALMIRCAAFLYPSLHEGFGIPPLEALSCGAKLILSNTTSLPEIFKKSAFYFSPFDYNIDFNDALNYEPIGREEVLKEYSWKRFASKLLLFIRTHNYFL